MRSLRGVLEPKPVQKPYPPVWWGGESQRSRELVAETADGWLIRSSTPEEAEEKLEDMASRLEEKGRKGKRNELGYAIPGNIYLDESDEEARRHLKQLVEDNSSMFEELLQRAFLGSPESVAERILKLSELGFDYIIFRISPALKTLEEIEKKLLPLLQ